jgi:hypothetical protein
MGLQSPHMNIDWLSGRLKVPSALGLCKPHLLQLIVAIALDPPKGDPPSLDL